MTDVAAVDLDTTMSLASGLGVVPKGQRNAGYKKLGYGPGEGGFILAQEAQQEPASGSMQAFLAGVAAGADPQQLAKELSGGSQPVRRRGR